LELQMPAEELCAGFGRSHCRLVTGSDQGQVAFTQGTGIVGSGEQ
jgi:hypothetical protein